MTSFKTRLAEAERGRHLFEEKCFDGGLACHQFAAAPIGHNVSAEMGGQRSPRRGVASHQAIDTVAVDRVFEAADGSDLFAVLEASGQIRPG